MRDGNRNELALCICPENEGRLERSYEGWKHTKFTFNHFSFLPSRLERSYEGWKQMNFRLKNFATRISLERSYEGWKPYFLIPISLRNILV